MRKILKIIYQTNLFYGLGNWGPERAMFSWNFIGKVSGNARLAISLPIPCFIGFLSNIPHSLWKHKIGLKENDYKHVLECSNGKLSLTLAREEIRFTSLLGGW